MIFNKIFEKLEKDKSVQNFLRGAANYEYLEKTIVAPEGIHATLYCKIIEQNFTVIVTSSSIDAENIATTLQSEFDKEEYAIFPGWETLPYEQISPQCDTVGRRLEILFNLQNKDNKLKFLIVPIKALTQPIIVAVKDIAPIELFLEKTLDFQSIISQLTIMAYKRVDMVTRKGEFAVRGGILDIFSPTADYPLRIDFFGNTISDMRWFSIADQRSFIKEIPQIIFLFPCSELLLTPEIQDKATVLQNQDKYKYLDILEKISNGIAVEGMEALAPILVENMQCLTDFLPENTNFIITDMLKISRRSADLITTNAEFLAAAWSWAGEGAKTPLDIAGNSFISLSDIKNGVLHSKNIWWNFTAIAVEDNIPDTDIIEIVGSNISNISGQVEKTFTEIRELVKHNWSILVTVAANGTQKRILELLQEYDVPAKFYDINDTLNPGTVHIAIAEILTGFKFSSTKFVIFTENDIFVNRHKRSLKKSSNLPAKKNSTIDLLQLQSGDYIVHEQHGVGKFIELVTRSTGSGAIKQKREYLVLEYAASKRGHPRDKLFIPTDQLGQITRYIGGESPVLNKIGGGDWDRTKQKARKAVKEITNELVKLYSARMSSKGFAFSPDTPWQGELEAAFPHIETPDQITTINEVKADMEKPAPMDRLISGDVGYGKTEIAVRAAFKATQDAKQVAILAPTTLLVQQHVDTFMERFASFPLVVKGLSRFQTPQDVKETIAGLAAGTVDVVIGTHRIFSKNIVFKDLGLVVVDEEQRFGVEHKEKLKTLRTNVDVLSMSATPIPRTLEMGITGIREMSVLATPPELRHPVLTYVGEYSDKQIGAAIRRELMRDGQVFFVHNRVSSIDKMAAHLQNLVPDARIRVAHGKLPERDLEQIIIDFWEKSFDVLVCTTIIETGIDISNANTLIVDRADMYGLSQLHQLRGRVGRAQERAYAYFLYSPDKPLGEIALERLKAVATHNELGVGMQLAMKDLEIRGAGNLLGGEQSGNISGVGFDLYMRLVGESISGLKGEVVDYVDKVNIDLPVNAYLPHDYIPGEQLRLEIYRRFSGLCSEGDIEKLLVELKDRYGEIPDPVVNLIEIARLKILANKFNLTEIVMQGNFIKFYPVILSESVLMKVNRLYKGSVYKSANSFLLIPKYKKTFLDNSYLIDNEVVDWISGIIKILFN